MLHVNNPPSDEQGDYKGRSGKCQVGPASLSLIHIYHAAGLSGLVREKTRFLMPPIPNLYFTRDPFACIGRGVSLNHMYPATRNRETIYGGYILRYHADFAGRIPLYYTPQEHFSIEGGDILNLSEHVLAVGMSQRTQPEAIEQLAKNIFADEESHITTVLAFEIPRTRA